jgi:predicted AAA+ superfamily ATPase
VQSGQYDFIETGSLISIYENVKDITIPLEERTISMYHMDFEEFCQALGKQQLHKKALLLFKQYMYIGSMPIYIPIIIFYTRRYINMNLLSD